MTPHPLNIRGRGGSRTRGVRLLVPCRGARVGRLALLARHHGSPPAGTRDMGCGTCSLTQMVGDTSLNMGRHCGEGYKPPWGGRGGLQALEPPRTRRKLLISSQHKRCSRSPPSSLSPQPRSRGSSPTAVSCRTRSTDKSSRDGLYILLKLEPSISSNITPCGQMIYHHGYLIGGIGHPYQ